MLLADRDAFVCYANSTAEHILSRGQGLACGRKRLQAETTADTRQLHRLIRECGQAMDLACQGNSMLVARTGLPPLRVVVAPFRPRWRDIGMAAEGAVAMVLVTDPARRSDLCQQLLRSRFGLTAGEARVALEIASAEGRAAAASRLGVTVATLKTHLIHVFEKTGVSRQAELVRLVLEATEGL